MFHIHIPVEGISECVTSIIKMWRGEGEESRAILFSDPAAARRDRFWRITLKITVTLGFLLILAIPVWLFVKMAQMDPALPDAQPQHPRVTKAERAAARAAQPGQPASPPQGVEPDPVQP